MTTFVKICGLSDPEAVRAAVDAGADAVGFVFYDRSPRNISADKAAMLAADVPASVRRVAVMLHPDSDRWDEVCRILRPDVLQTDSDDFACLNVPASIEQWPVLREGFVDAEESLPDTFVYEGRRSGQGQSVDWNSAAVIAGRGQMILAGGLTTDNVADAINRVMPYGVDVSSAVETAPGKKDAAMIAAFVAAAKAVRQDLEKGKVT